jgi:hypothetical protein
MRTSFLVCAVIGKAIGKGSHRTRPNNCILYSNTQPGSSEDTGRLTVYNDPDYEYAD